MLQRFFDHFDVALDTSVMELFLPPTHRTHRISKSVPISKVALLTITPRHETFWIGPTLRRQNDFIWSISSIQARLHLIYIKPEEKRFTQDNKFTEFWWDETEVLLRPRRFFICPLSWKKCNIFVNKTKSSLIHNGFVCNAFLISVLQEQVSGPRIKKRHNLLKEFPSRNV